MRLFTALFAITLFGLTGCATTMSEDECLTSDWRTVGYEDGVQGRSGAAIGTYRKACAKAGVTPDLAEYQAGRQEGLQEYCRPQNGYNAGERGASYQGVCPAELENAFLAAYEEGRTLYELRADVRRLESDIVRAENEIADIDATIESETLRMVSDGLLPEERLEILAETKRLSERKGQLRDRLVYLAEELGASRERLDEYRALQTAATTY
ncbi:MAG: DUF2799 domain-containing protein [Pseudomonadota bacterium]